MADQHFLIYERDNEERSTSWKKPEVVCVAHGASKLEALQSVVADWATTRLEVQKVSQISERGFTYLYGGIYSRYVYAEPVIAVEKSPQKVEKE